MAIKRSHSVYVYVPRKCFIPLLAEILDELGTDTAVHMVWLFFSDIWNASFYRSLGLTRSP
jgi:hypothetical protein